MSCMGLYEFMRRLLGESVNKLFIYIQPLQFYQYRVANTNNIPTLFGKFLFYFRLLPLLQQQFKLVSNIFYNEQKTAFSNISIFYWRYDNLLHLLTAQRWTYILSDKRARWRRRRATPHSPVLEHTKFWQSGLSAAFSLHFKHSLRQVYLVPFFPHSIFVVIFSFFFFVFLLVGTYDTQTKHNRGGNGEDATAHIEKGGRGSCLKERNWFVNGSWTGGGGDWNTNSKHTYSSGQQWVLGWWELEWPNILPVRINNKRDWVSGRKGLKY